jgi:hypothetical protein
MPEVPMSGVNPQSAGYLEDFFFYLKWLAVVKGVVCY